MTLIHALASRTWPAAIVLASMFHASANAAVPAYNVTLIQGPGTSGAAADKINNVGQVVGGTDSSGAFVWSNGEMTLLGASSLYAYGINAAGSVAGTQAGLTSNAIVWQSGQLTVLPPATGSNGDSTARAINDQGDVAGMSGGRAVVWRNGSAEYLAATGAATDPTPMDINNQGHVVGSIAGRGVVWRDGSVVALNGGSGAPSVSATAINDAGWVVGRTSPLTGVAGVATVWRDDGQIAMTLGGANGLTNTYANDINNQGSVVGWATVSNPQGGGFPYGAAIPMLWDASGQAFSLRSLVGEDYLQAEGLMLKVATGINDQGQIVGWGLKNSRQVGFVLTPVPEPGSLALTALGLAAVGAAVRRSVRN